MRSPCLLAAFAAILSAPAVHAQAIIAQSSGLPSPDHVIDFGANLFPNFTNVSTQFTGITITHSRYFTTSVANNLVGGFLTNDFSGAPDTLSIKFATPISDLSFVYHQIGSGSSNFRVLLASVEVDSFSNSSNQFQTNNYFGFTNVVFDELQVDFVIDFNLDTLAFNDAGPAVSAYCTSSTSTSGCTASISGSGTPSASAGSGFTISIAGVEGQKTGLVFYGINNSGFIPLPWATGSTSFLCVKPPTQRSLPQSSGGTAGACNGVLSIDWNAFITANPGALGTPFNGTETVFAQGWFRDPAAPKTTNLSNALQFAVAP
ncbi:MAG: hypothetical protein IT454_00770 [Planctomycetes bacterium]|nr:hypothetical protein [Planctomycetota bacterium]